MSPTTARVETDMGGSPVVLPLRRLVLDRKTQEGNRAP